MKNLILISLLTIFPIININASNYVSESYFKKDMGYDWVSVSLKDIDAHNAKISIKSRADLEHNPKLKENFNWLGTFEVIYEENIVTSNFDIWEKNKKITKYKQNIIDIANILDNNLDKSILLQSTKSLRNFQI